MGVDYSYVNHDKLQYFQCGLFNSSRYPAIGLGPGARALAILLSERGTWAKDRISVVSDTGEEYANLLTNGRDIEVEVVLMLIDFDAAEWIESQLDENILAFNLMCEIAIHMRRPDVIRTLDNKCGAGKWQQRYQKHATTGTDFRAQKVIEARERSLKIVL